MVVGLVGKVFRKRQSSFFHHSAKSAVALVFEFHILVLVHAHRCGVRVVGERARQIVFEIDTACSVKYDVCFGYAVFEAEVFDHIGVLSRRADACDDHINDVKAVPNKNDCVVSARVGEVGGNPHIAVCHRVVVKDGFCTRLRYWRVEVAFGRDVPITLKILLCGTTANHRDRCRVTAVAADRRYVFGHTAQIERERLDEVLPLEHLFFAVHLSQTLRYFNAAVVEHVFFRVSPHNIVYGLAVDVEIAHNAVSVFAYIAVFTYVPINERANPMVFFGVGGHKNVSRPLAFAAVTGHNLGKTFPSVARTFIENYQIILTTFETLTYRLAALVCNVGEVYHRPARKVDVRVSRLYNLYALAENLTKSICNTAASLQVAEVVTQVQSTEIRV